MALRNLNVESTGSYVVDKVIAIPTATALPVVVHEDVCGHVVARTGTAIWALDEAVVKFVSYSGCSA